MVKLISYTNMVDNDVIICAPEDEQQIIYDFFISGNRCRDDYDRKEHRKYIQVVSSMSTSGE